MDNDFPTAVGAPDRDNPLLAQYRQRQQELRDLRAKLDTQDWSPPDPFDDAPKFSDYRLKPITASTLAPLTEPIPLAEARTRFTVQVHEYLDSSSEAALLVKIPPGGGKTHGMVSVAQFFARRGLRGLWAASRHNMFADLENFAHFDPALWYHWKGVQGEDDAGVAMCRYAEAQAGWSLRGYDTMGLCQQLCGHWRDNHIAQCAYRLQEKRKEPLIFGHHYHLTTGLGISRFDFAVIDELPISAFVQERVIPYANLDVGAVGPLGEMVKQLRQAAAFAPKGARVAGRALFNQLDALGDAYAQVDVEIAIPEPPHMYSAQDVEHAPYWYLFDFLRLAAPELQCHNADWPNWNERVWVTQAGLHLLERNQLWEKLPKKLIVLDATAQPDLYRIMFDRPMQVYAPRLERKGKLYQVSGRLNAKATMMKKRDLSEQGKEMVQVVEALAVTAKSPAVICWKALQPYFAKRFGAERVMTFGALRGTNALQDCDLLAVVGTYTPNGSAMLDMAAALSGQLAPFWKLDANNKREPIYLYQDREYRLTAAGVECVQAQFGEDTRGVTRRTGYYADGTLDALHRQLREAELIQAIHRARLNLRDATVWLVTSTPVQDEPLDGLWNDPPIAPIGMHWQVWLKLQPWLDGRYAAGESIDYEKLAMAAQVALTWAQRQKWLQAIANFQPERWILTDSRPENYVTGRPQKTLVPLMATSVKYRVN